MTRKDCLKYNRKRQTPSSGPAQPKTVTTGGRTAKPTQPGTRSAFGRTVLVNNTVREKPVENIVVASNTITRDIESTNIVETNPAEVPDRPVLWVIPPWSTDLSIQRVEETYFESGDVRSEISEPHPSTHRMDVESSDPSPVKQGEIEQDWATMTLFSSPSEVFGPPSLVSSGCSLSPRELFPDDPIEHTRPALPHIIPPLDFSSLACWRDPSVPYNPPVKQIPLPSRAEVHREAPLRQGGVLNDNVVACRRPSSLGKPFFTFTPHFSPVTSFIVALPDIRNCITILTLPSEPSTPMVTIPLVKKVSLFKRFLSLFGRCSGGKVASK